MVETFARMMGGETGNDLRWNLFQLVANKKHWKDTVRGRVPKRLAHLVPAICDAVAYFTATGAETFVRKDGQTVIYADGYWAGPAGDH